MEIERKFIPKRLPDHLEDYPYHEIEQGYLCTDPAIRIRKMDDSYFLTYKSSGLMAREEYEMPLTEEAYLHLRKKTDGMLITKRRYLIPLIAERTAHTQPSACEAGSTQPLHDVDKMDSAQPPYNVHEADSAQPMHNVYEADSAQPPYNVHEADSAQPMHNVHETDSAHVPLAAHDTYTIELDLFYGELNGITLAEVEFASVEEAESFVPPEWFGEDVTYDGRYHNSAMSRGSLTALHTAAEHT